MYAHKDPTSYRDFIPVFDESKMFKVKKKFKAGCLVVEAK
jgi:hypothetical protein